MENARALLKGYSASKTRIAMLSAELTSMTTSLNNVRAVPETDGYSTLAIASETAAHIVELLAREINEAATRCDLVIAALSSLNDSDERAVLELHYISELTLREIASEKLYCSLTTVKNLHRRGLTKVEDYLTKLNNGDNKKGITMVDGLWPHHLLHEEVG